MYSLVRIEPFVLGDIDCSVRKVLFYYTGENAYDEAVSRMKELAASETDSDVMFQVCEELRLFER